MKILFYNMAPLYNMGGIEEFLLDVAHCLSKRHKITICTLSHGYSFLSGVMLRERIKNILDDVKTGKYSYKVFKGIVNRNIVLSKDFVDLLNDHDILYFENFAFPSIFAARPTIYGFHVDFNFNLWAKILLKIQHLKRLTLGIHTLNPDDYCFFKQRLGHNKNRIKVFLIPHGVDINKFKPYENVPDLDTFKILYVGRLSIEKGVNLLPYIVQELLKKGLKFKLIIVGPDFGAGEVIAKMSNKYPDFVEYLGAVPRTFLPKIYASAHATLIPSYKEKFSLVAIESLACGTPIVTSSLPCFKYILYPLERSLNIRLRASTHSPKEFANIITNLLQNKEKYCKLRKKSREIVIKRFSIDRIACEIERMFTQILEIHAHAR